MIEYEINNKVSVFSMAPDKLIGDVRRVTAIIIGKTGTRDIFYELLTSFGILSIKYRASDLELYYGGIPEEVKISHPTMKANLSKIHCECQGKCYKDRGCVCFKNNKDCYSHCENHLSGKKCNCTNMGKHK